MVEIGEELRQAMRRWTTGVTIVTSRFGDQQHGMAVNSLASVSLDPPRVVITLAHATRTYNLVMELGVFGITVLSDLQQAVSDRFSGKVLEVEDRFAGLDTFTLVTGAPLLEGGLAFMDCQVVSAFPMPQSTLFIGEVLAARATNRLDPLVYFDRRYHRLEP